MTHRFVPTWLVGVTLGVAIRMVVLGHYRWNQLSFLAVALVFVGAVAFVAWRMLRGGTTAQPPAESPEQKRDFVARVQAGIALNKMPPR